MTRLIIQRDKNERENKGEKYIFADEELEDSAGNYGYVIVKH